MSASKIINCQYCGKPFVPFANGRTCARCLEEQNEQFTRVQSYLRSYPESTVEDVAEECGVAVDIVMDWMRKGRLEALPSRAGVDEGSPQCRVCGTPIDRSGGLCARCASTATQLANLHAQGAQTPAPVPASKYRQRPERRLPRGDSRGGYAEFRRMEL